MVHQVEHLFHQEGGLVLITACEKSNTPRGQRQVLQAEHTTEQKLRKCLGVLNIWIKKNK